MFFLIKKRLILKENDLITHKKLFFLNFFYKKYEKKQLFFEK